MVIRIPRPSEVFDAAQTVAGMPVRLVSRLSVLVDNAEELLARADRLLTAAEQAVTAVAAATTRAEAVIARAETTTGKVQELIEVYGPLADRAAPMARQFVDELSEQEVHAAIQLIDQLPALTVHMRDDIMPILGTLDRVGPDVHELLEVTRDVRQAILGVPGFGFFRRRGEDRADRDQDQDE